MDARLTSKWWLRFRVVWMTGEAFGRGSYLIAYGKIEHMCQSRFRANENPFEIGGVWGGRSPPSKSSRKHAQSKPRSSKNHPKVLGFSWQSWLKT